MAKPRVNPECVDPGPRLYRNVYQFDVAMMYPSFVRFFKLDPTCVEEGELPRTFYDKVPDVDIVLSKLREIRDRGCGPRPVWWLVNKLIEVRMKTKAMKKMNKRFEHLDNAVKAVLNALAFGVLGKRGWGPLSNDAIAEAIFHGTRAAQYHLFYKAAESKLLKEKGCRPIYSDTDSIYIACSRRLKEEEVREIHDELNKIVAPFGLVLDYEGEWRLMLIHGKKNYILIGDDGVKIKGSYFHRLAEYELPPVISDMISEIMLGRRGVDEALRLVDTAPLDEISIEMHNMISRTVLKTEKERRRPKNVCIVKTPWFEVPYGRLMRLHVSGFHHPRRVCLLAEAYRLGMGSTVRIELSQYDALTIIDAVGYANHADTSIVASRVCGGNYSVIIEDGRVVCVKIMDARYVLRDVNEFEIPSCHSGCDGRPVLEAVKFEGFSAKPVSEETYRSIVKKYLRSMLESLIVAK